MTARTQAQALLLQWYKSNKRGLPWRKNRDPYRIWISEIMLQQTTSRAVIPYFERFVERFPDVKTLSSAPLEDVLELWAGLGYYSRARMLHKAAQMFAAGFPKRFEELIEYPGLGPYTARAVASLAFGQSVGVLDGNVIRILSRLHNMRGEWWKPAVREEYQKRSDMWVKDVASNEMNQAMMELGATICLPQNPACLQCPVHAHCEGRKVADVNELPLKKPRREREIWVWEPAIIKKNQCVLLVPNRTAPFLKNSWLPPGNAKQVKKAPKSFHFRHSITHHDIFVTIQKRAPKLKLAEKKWVKTSELSRHVPASLVRKALAEDLR